jgi:cell division septation protein DedD
MDKHLKKRILGAVVTVVVLAIALPVVIDGSRQQLPLNDDMPPMPPMPDWTEVENQQRIRIDLEKLARGEAQQEVAPPSESSAEQVPSDTALARVDDRVPVTPDNTMAATVPVVVREQKTLTTNNPETAVVARTTAVESRVNTAEPAPTVSAPVVPAAPVASVASITKPAPGNASTGPGSVDASGLPYAWVIQIGAFSQETNGISVRDRLRKDGFKAYSSSDADGLTRVYAGPEVSDVDAERLRIRLQMALDRNDLKVKRYIPR